MQLIKKHKSELSTTEIIEKIKSLNLKADKIRENIFRLRQELRDQLNYLAMRNVLDEWDENYMQSYQFWLSIASRNPYFDI